MDFLQRAPFLFAALIPALTFHEWGHAAMAKFFGDDTAEKEGRLTLNPFAHLDLMGSLMILFVGFGWAKPVPIDPRNMKHPWAEFWVAAAGPMMNIVLALGFTMLGAVLHLTGVLTALEPEVLKMVLALLFFSVALNIALCLFNLLPVRPLDGHYIMARLLPKDSRKAFMQLNMRYGAMIIFGAILIDVFFRVGIFLNLIWKPSYQTAESLFTGVGLTQLLELL